MRYCNCILLYLLVPVFALKRDLRPNFVIIMADDMGWGDVGANWPETVDTPTIDRLAREGLRFTDFHAGASVCTPSRAALLTGRLGLRTGLIKNFGEEALNGIPINETTIAEVLSNAGYRTAMLGKWHLGTRPGHHPLDKGFQSYLGIPYSLDMGCADPPGANLPPCPACPEDNSVYLYAPAPANCIVNPALPLYNNYSIAHQPAKLENLATLYADFAKSFIQNRTSSAPYFLYAALSHMHVPLAHSKQFDNITGRGTYADTLREMDELVRLIVQDIDNNTLIWFTTDNGPWEEKCELAGSGGPFIGMWQGSSIGGGGGSVSKKTIWEAGHRVPSIIHWPEYTKGGMVSGALTSSLDIFPTLTMLAGASFPPYRYFDGYDITDIIKHTAKSVRQILFHPNSLDNRPGEIDAVRIGIYKVVYYTGGVPDCSGYSAPEQNHKNSPLVFQLDIDPSESVPLDPTSKEYSNVIELARLAVSDLMNNIKTDNSSTVNYKSGKEGRICCNLESPICRCPWD